MRFPRRARERSEAAGRGAALREYSLFAVIPLSAVTRSEPTCDLWRPKSERSGQART
jgi:hypothetical protein